MVVTREPYDNFELSKKDCSPRGFEPMQVAKLKGWRLKTCKRFDMQLNYAISKIHPGRKFRFN